MAASSTPKAKSTYSRLWAKVRPLALTPWQGSSPLMARPYGLRHAGVTWQLTPGVPAAEWAGHSVEVLQRIYHRCMVGMTTYGSIACTRPVTRWVDLCPGAARGGRHFASMAVARWHDRYCGRSSKKPGQTMLAWSRVPPLDSNLRTRLRRPATIMGLTRRNALYAALPVRKPYATRARTLYRPAMPSHRTGHNTALLEASGGPTGHG